MKNLVDIKKLKAKDIYKWPLKMRLIAGAFVSLMIFIAGYFLIISEHYSTLESEIEKEDILKKEFLDKNKQAVNLTLYKQQLIEITQASDALLKQLPNKSEVEKLLIDINQSGIGRGLKFDLFKPNAQKVAEYYAELPISIRLTGNYTAIGNFASDLSQLSRVVILKDIQLSVINDSKSSVNTNNNLTLAATAQTFRYLDQDEIDKQLAEKKEKNKKNKKNKKDKKESEGK